MNEKTFDESKFIVINKKRFAEMGVEEGAMAYQMLSNAIASFEHDYEKITGKQMKQKYIVCNADEPYAERVKAIILGTEEARDAAIRQAAMEEAGKPVVPRAMLEDAIADGFYCKSVPNNGAPPYARAGEIAAKYGYTVLDATK